MAKKPKNTGRGDKQTPKGNKGSNLPVLTPVVVIDYTKPLSNPKHERFCQEWVKSPINCFNNTLSYIAAYPTAKPRGAAAAACLLLTHINIQDRIKQLQKEFAEDADITGRMLLLELKKVGFSNIDDFIRVDDEGNVFGKDFDGIDRNKLAAIESIKQTVNITSKKDGEREYETRNFTFKLHDKLSALEKIGKHIGFFEKDNDQQRNVVLIKVMDVIDGSNKGKLPSQDGSDSSGRSLPETLERPLLATE